MKKLITILFFSVSTFALVACEDRITNTNACLSMEFYRFKLGKFIFDLPSRVRGSPESEELFYKSFKPISVDIRRSLTTDNVSECQIKELAPYDAGRKLSVTYRQNESDGDRVLKIFERIDKSFMELWTATFYISQNEPNKPYLQDKFGVFKISELAALRVKSDEPGVDARGKFDPVSSEIVFELGGREQRVECDRIACSGLWFKDEYGLFYNVWPRRYVAKIKITQQNKDNLKNFDIVAAEDLPETVIPVLNFARSLRNRDAEKDMK